MGGIINNVGGAILILMKSMAGIFLEHDFRGRGGGQMNIWGIEGVPIY